MLTILPAASEQCVFLICARHHACESAGSYLFEGFVERYLAARFHGNRIACGSRLIGVPMVDFSGVMAGDQGKARQPHDHNRDYGTSSRYATTRGIRRLPPPSIPLVAVDFHTPGLVGPMEEQPYIVSSSDYSDQVFGRSVIANLGEVGILDDRAAGTALLVFDEEWNQPSADRHRGFAAWVRSLPQAVAAVTVEYPNACDRNNAITKASATTFGAAIADAILDNAADAV